MKKTLIFILTLGLAFFLGSCNTPGDPGDTGGGDGDEVEIDMTGSLYLLEQKEGTYAATIDISSHGILDVRNYQSVTITAKLYSDEEGTTLVTAAEAATATENTSLGYFKLLKENNNWDSQTNWCGGAKYNMVLDGENTLNFGEGDSGVPKFVLLETQNENIVKSIGVSKIVFTPRTTDVDLDHLFGDSVAVSGNRITFTNACYSSTDGEHNWDGTAGVGGAALYIFKSSFFPLEGKTTLTFNFRLENYHTTGTVGGATVELEHQLHIQAAENTSSKDKFNGRNTQPGQKYITLEDNMTNGAGSFTVSVSELLAAAAAAGNAGDINGPFNLDAVRIVNNGTKWDEEKGGTTITHYREKSYVLIIEEVTIQ